jgi:uncharacterized membrane protein YeaQ/YmgE (transglycosylase-associated protein family)
LTLGDFGVMLLIGLLAGWLAGFAMRGGGYGLLGNLALGVVGAAVGGAIFGFLGVTAYGFPGRVVVAAVGAVVIVALARFLRGAPVAKS